jgi:hypothetical protein
MTAKISTANKTRLNKMNRAAQNVTLGTMIQNMGFISTGSLTVTAAQMNASRVEVPTGLDSVGGFTVQGRRSGSPLFLKVTAGSVAGAIIVENSTITTVISALTGGSQVNTGDVISYVAFA